MYPAPIEIYERPATIAEAIEAMGAAGEDTVFIAGGMSLMQAVKARLVQPRGMIDLNDIEELEGLSKGPRGVAIRAMTRYRNLMKVSALHGAHQAITDAASTVGDRQVRNAGTIGGSLCWNYVASCMPTAVLCLGAELELHSPSGGERRVAITDFLLGPLETARDDQELLVEIHLPKASLNAASAYKKYGGTVDGLPIIGVAAYVEVDDEGRCTDARLAVGGILPCAQRFDGIADVLRGRPGDEKNLSDAAAAAADAIETQSDHWASAHYRKVLIRTLGRTVLTRAHRRAHEKTFRDSLP
jgi:carbon-monoxide dehydrogenase medium subunit